MLNIYHLIYVKYNIYIFLKYLIFSHSHGYSWHFYTLEFGLNPCDKHYMKLKDVKIQAKILSPLERRLPSFKSNLLEKQS